MACTISPGEVHSRMPIAIQLIPDAEGMMSRRVCGEHGVARACFDVGGVAARSPMRPLPAGVGIGEPGPRVTGGFENTENDG